MIHNFAMFVFSEFLDIPCPSEWIQAALVLSFFSTWVVIGVFWYLNRFTKKSYFNLWTISWLFFALWIAVAIEADEMPALPGLQMTSRTCLGIAAVCMFWGSFELTGAKRRTRRELALSIFLILAWSFMVELAEGGPWMALPMFALLAGASLYTGYLYLRLRTRYHGASMLSAGFILFGIHLLIRPFIDRSWVFGLTASYGIAALLGLFIALGMVVQVLEEGREQNETLLEEFKSGMNARRLLQEEAAVSEQKYRAVFEAASDAFFLVDLETLEIIEHNESAHAFVGDRPPAGGQRSFLDLCPSLEGDGSRSLLANKRMFDKVFDNSHEFQMTRPDGTSVPCEGAVTLVQYTKRPVLQVNVREITERKSLEQQLRRSEKLGALGQLTAGVAHELNNPLAVIMGYAQILSTQLDDRPKVKGDVIKILRESERAAKIVRNLLTFARPRDPQMLNVDLNRLVANILEAYESECESAGVKVHAQLTPNLPMTVADPHQIEQVLTNLIVNALQAMQSVAGPRELTVATSVADRCVVMSIADNGPGIPADVITKVFDPFFSTKGPGKGTGLGLSISHSIVREHRGRIWVKSEAGNGATFFVELPLINCPVEERVEEIPVAPPAPVQNPMAASYRLLCVDDEPGIVEVMVSIFTGNGYTVDTAGNGHEALEQIAGHHYDLIISDLCMPGIDGEGLYRQVKAKDATLASRIIFVTGDTVSVKSRTFLEWTGNRWMSKPFKITELEEVVANFLQSSTAMSA